MTGADSTSLSTIMVTTLSVDFSEACQLQYQDGCSDFAEKNYTITVTDATLIHTCDKVEVYKGVARIVPDHIDDSLSQGLSYILFAFCSVQTIFPQHYHFPENK